jgi:hypothetical protein
MSFLPLSSPPEVGDHGYMNPFFRLARRTGTTITEMNYALKRSTQLRLAYDRHLDEPDAAPGTYAEFLLRTSAPLRHEPSAAARESGRLVR